MNRHYSDAKIFNWLRAKLNIIKPYALPWGEWEEWENKLKKRRPVAFFLTETLPEWLEKPAEWIVDPIANVKYYIQNRWVTKSHCLTSDLKKGQWYDYETRLMHSLFNELKNFVEIEKAHLNVIVCGDSENRNKYQLPWWRRFYLLRWGSWRCAEAGIDHLNWEIGLSYNEDYGVHPGDPLHGKPTPQAESAKEILDLYNWWTVRRPARPDVHDASGWTEVCEKIRVQNNGKLFAEVTDRNLKREQSKSHKLMKKLEKQYDREDERMMIRLIKVRRSMWT